jgi:hypothetical protein
MVEANGVTAAVAVLPARSRTGKDVHIAFPIENRAFLVR